MKKYGNLIVKAVSLAIMLGMLWYYQGIAVQRAEALEANRAAIAEVEEYNRGILREQEEAERQAQAAQHAAAGESVEAQPEESYICNDGTYEASAAGYGGDITVAVTVEADEIIAVEVLSHDGEDPAYFMMAQSVTDAILSAQSAEVDTVTGATFSSSGIIGAAAAALEQAVK